MEGTLVEKAADWNSACLGSLLAGWINQIVRSRNLGLVIGGRAGIRLADDLIRLPSVAFIHWNRCPGRRRPTQEYPRIIPNLIVEFHNRSNTRREMAIKRREYFAAGVELVWEVDPRKRIVTVYTAPTESRVLTEADTLDAGAVLPGFSLPLADLFAELDRRG